MGMKPRKEDTSAAEIERLKKVIETNNEFYNRQYRILLDEEQKATNKRRAAETEREKLKARVAELTSGLEQAPPTDAQLDVLVRVVTARGPHIRAVRSFGGPVIDEAMVDFVTRCRIALDGYLVRSGVIPAVQADLTPAEPTPEAEKFETSTEPRLDDGASPLERLGERYALKNLGRARTKAAESESDLPALNVEHMDGIEPEPEIDEPT